MSAKKTGKGHGEGSKGTRIKTGEVRNPKGRPVGSRNVETIVRSAFTREVQWTEKDKTLKGPLIAAFLDSVQKQGMKDVRFAQLVVDIMISLAQIDAQRELQQQETENFEKWKELINVYRMHHAKLMDLDDNELTFLIKIAKARAASPLSDEEFYAEFMEKIRERRK